MTVGDAAKILVRRLFPSVFTLRIRNGEARLEHGTVTRAFLEDCSSMASREKVNSGWIWGVGTGDGVRLDFSSGINGKTRQKFRNIAGIHGF